MLSAIREIGKWQIQKSKKDELDTLVQEPFKSGKVIIIKIDFDKKSYNDVELEDYDSSKRMEYLFRKGPSNGPNLTPTAIIQTAEKTFNNKIQAWFDKYSGESKFFSSIKEILLKNKDEIIKEISRQIDNLEKKEKKLLTLKIKRNGEFKYLGDFDEFKNSIKENESKKTSQFAENDKVCSVCGKQKSSVAGNVGVFKFYTIDKPGFIIGGFNEKEAWKNFPVCPECKLELEEGKKFIENNLTFEFYGLRYLLIPKLLLGGIEDNYEVMDNLLKSSKKVSLKDRVRKSITSDNNDILDILAEEKDILTVNFLFLRKEQGAERILLLIEDVFPSRIRKIFEAKDYVDRVFNNDSDKGFTFGTIRTFFSKSSEGKRESDLNKYFLEIVDSVFKGRCLDWNLLLKFYMASIRKEFINDGYFMPRVKNSLMNTMFFQNLGLINFEEVNDMEESIFEEVFKRYGKSFGSPAKRGVFLLGALTQLLLNKQWTERNAKPFMKKT
ncbi:MAG: TIGR02556 family CRISPR-associated protein [Bacteroidales bacterium]